jgi:hypothetical protein
VPIGEPAIELRASQLRLVGNQQCEPDGPPSGARSSVLPACRRRAD